MIAERLVAALGARRAGTSWQARCPAHEDRTPSLSIRVTPEGRVLIYCHAGCAYQAVIDALRGRGLWPTSTRSRQPRWVHRPQDHSHAGSRSHRDAALSLWRRTDPAADTLVETYLRHRGITADLPASVRFHPALTHPSGTRLPTMVALVTHGVQHEPVAIHRTFLATDGRAKAAVTPQKMMLGPCRGGVVQLATADDTVLIGEGLETCLAVRQVTGRPVWAALSTAGLRTLQLPTTIRAVTILADGDTAGDQAARAAATRWTREGRTVRIARPPTGLDFNDVLLGDDVVDSKEEA